MLSILNTTFLVLLIVYKNIHANKEPHSRLSSPLFERINKINKPFLISDNIKGTDTRNTSENIVFSTIYENRYKYQQLQYLINVKSVLLKNLPPEFISSFSLSSEKLNTGSSFEFNNIFPNKELLKMNIPVYFIEPNSIANIKNIKNGGLYDDFLHVI